MKKSKLDRKIEKTSKGLIALYAGEWSKQKTYTIGSMDVAFKYLDVIDKQAKLLELYQEKITEQATEIERLEGEFMNASECEDV